MAGYARPDMLVSTDWVAAHASEEGVRLIEVDVDTETYEEGHIRGAVGLNWTSQLCDPVRRDILTREPFQGLCRQSGFGNDSTLVFYGDNHNWFACFALWLFRYYGHDEHRLKLMNGGRTRWIAERRALVVDPPSVRRAAYWARPPDPSVRAMRDEVLSHVGRDAVNLVDVRSPLEFTGQIIAPPGMNETALRGGHIPGARNIPWSRAMRQDGTFRPYEELQALYESEDLVPGRPTIAYCRIGERSSHTWFVLTYLLGWEQVKNYDGSWTEWGNLIGAPIEKP